MGRLHQGRQGMRSGTRRQTNTSRSSATRRQYRSNHPGTRRQSVRPARYDPAAAHGNYKTQWPTAGATAAAGNIENAGQGNVKKTDVEELGVQGAKWWLATQLLDQAITDDPANSGVAGKFSTFSGANTVNVFYKDGTDVYVLEAKGGSSGYGTRTGVYAPNAGKTLTQGTLAYLEDVANAMVNSGVAGKVKAGNDILAAIAAGKIHYITVKTGYTFGPPFKTKTPKQIP